MPPSLLPFLAACLTLALAFTPVKLHASEQYPDYLIYNGKEYELESKDVYPEIGILQPYLEKMNKRIWTMGVSECSALNRGYYVIFEIINNELVIKDIKDCEKSILKTFLLSAFNVKGSMLKMDWFTDSLVIGEGKPLYGFYECYSKFHFKKGMLVKEERIGYKEYTSSFLNSYQNINLEGFEHYLETEKEAQSEFLANLKKEYKRKFGEPISDFELTIQEIDFWNKYKLRITRTLYGARAIYVGEDQEEWVDVKLNIEEWLDFIRALYTCCFDKWDKNPISHRYYNEIEGVLWVSFSSKGKPYTYNNRVRIKDQLPNLNGFEKAMKDMVAKIRKASAKPAIGSF